MSSNPTVILATGSWMTAPHVTPTRPCFESKGYTFVHTPLATVGHSNPPKTPSDDVTAIHSALTTAAQDATEMCLILHSAAGISGRTAISAYLNSSEPKKANVKLVLLAAYMDDFFAESTKPYYTQMCDFKDGYLFLKDPAYWLFGDLSDSEAQPFVEALEPHRAPDPAEIEIANATAGMESWKEVQAVYVVCSRDRAILPEYQRSVSERYGLRVVEINSDHCPMISRPDELARVVDEFMGQL